jgi:O-antigen/teichoic acid export membrane protein
VARSLGAVAFGAFSLAFVTYGVILNLSRGLATDPLSVRYSHAPNERWRGAVARSTGTAIGIGIATGVLCLIIGWALGGVVGTSFVGLGLTLPGLLLQDSWRYAFFAAGRGRSAFVNDLVWAIVLIPAMIIGQANGSAFGAVVAWGGSATVAALFGCVQAGFLPSWAGIGEWMRDHRDLGPRYVVENLSDSLSAQLRLYGLGVIAGLAAVGDVRAAQILMGPFLALRMGISLIAVPEAARVLSRNPRRLVRFCWLLGGSQALAGLLWGGALMLLPASIGEELLGSLWAGAYALLLPTILLTAGGSLFDGAFVGLRALGVSRLSMRTQLIRAVTTLVLGLAGAAVGGAAGSLWGALIGTLLGIEMASRYLRTATRERVASGTGGARPSPAR